MKIVKNRKFSAPVTVAFPPAVGGGPVEDSSFTAHFVTLSKSELKAFDMMSDASVEALLRRVLIGWDGIMDDVAEGDIPRPLPCRPDTVDLLIEDLAIARAILKAYIDAMSGIVRGN